MGILYMDFFNNILCMVAYYIMTFHYILYHSDVYKGLQAYTKLPELLVMLLFFEKNVFFLIRYKITYFDTNHSFYLYLQPAICLNPYSQSN